jgi:NAD(P)-dependent dehydrogenase (short-subunit alcohol dehydrogenase family)
MKGSIRIASCDVTSEQSIIAAVQFAKNEFKRIDILVNNAGYGLFGPIELLPVESARRQFEVNTIGPMRLVQLVVPGMREAGWGRIINVSSVAGRICVPMGGWYSASKHALEALTDALRLELRAFGIHAVSILPGPVETEFIPNIQTPMTDNEDVPGVYRKIGQTLRERNLSHRHGSISADRIADLIVRAASAATPKTRYIPTAQDRTGLWMKKLLPDRAWDKLIASFYKISDAIQPKKGKHTF